jgi:hypothetical protein
MPSVIAHTSDGEAWCGDCWVPPEDRYRDREEVGVIFDTDEHPSEGIFCGGCREAIVEPYCPGRTGGHRVALFTVRYDQHSFQLTGQCAYCDRWGTHYLDEDESDWS